MINIKDLNIRYSDGHDAVKNLSLQIDKGETVAIIGANGAGKSTLLLSMVGIIPISSGTISINEMDLNKKNVNEIRKTVGLVFQNPDDQLFMTHVYEDVAFGPRNSGYTEEEVNKRVENALNNLNITHLMQRAPSKLSGGEKRSVAIAGVLAMNPSVMLFDEPTSFLDPRSRRNLLPVLKSLQVTKIIATHDLDLAAEICDRVILLQNGVLVAQGNPQEILTNQQLLESGGL